MKYIVTSALPYANGKLHVGHVAGAYLPADIFVRYLRLQNQDVIYICGTDEHGTPISISADKEGVQPIDVVNRYHASIKEAFDGIGIEFDNFSGTAREEHHILSQEFFTALYNNGHIQPKSTLQFYCEHDKRYLPDRYVEGICPKCGAEGARGDQCDKCGNTYETTSLKQPRCKICGNKPIIKETKHWFLHLARFTEQLQAWIETKSYWKENVRNFMLNLLEQGLIERSITRDLSWGVPVPLPEADGKVLYVWFDAPIGYISSTIEWAKRMGNPELWKDYWLDPQTQLIHFIGKDNIIFHALIWPAMLMGQNTKYCLPHDIPANEFMNLEGQKISTSRNWAIWVDEFVRSFDGEYLRYYLAVNAPERQDADFSFKDFQQRINGELNNVLGNLANRVFTFANKHFGGMINKTNLDEDAQNILNLADLSLAEISTSYSEYQVKRNTKSILDIARMGNRFFDERKPWAVIKENKELVQQTLWVCAFLLHKISVALYPVLPKHMLKLRNMMSLPNVFDWNDAYATYNYTLVDVSPLFVKIEDAAIEKELNKLHNMAAVEPLNGFEAIKPEITYDQFSAMDLRLVKVLEAEAIPKTDKLLKLKVDLGFETRELVAGIAQSYNPESIKGKTVVMLVNLQARKIRGILSNGMILAAHDASGLHVIHPDGGSPGSVVQ
ncbi:MAG: methionine--tRNA ligase [Candidatus Cloacimonetes bacterium]|jgi:methionyl-tRNA synthetase|nr:methionine--tRNA ligase [Candidatus Cloacimonadota bacterium]MCB5278756.1 methionine--tRNA ligase [Candidatus Cloacimonadota bacterium]MDD2210416.1 methionine--tRNA ligase [Candidatus Cloacimonadota bacterium]MDD4232318.1 methionine--tRNA ligase [Candidatus Cloacimonadota bacterium]MDY0298740.1 methionine--tRNA ligase [Candidatus Cloacimonadaceae bacterium]